MTPPGVSGSYGSVKSYLSVRPVLSMTLRPGAVSPAEPSGQIFHRLLLRSQVRSAAVCHHAGAVEYREGVFVRAFGHDFSPRAEPADCSFGPFFAIVRLKTVRVTIS